MVLFFCSGIILGDIFLQYLAVFGLVDSFVVLVYPTEDGAGA